VDEGLNGDLNWRVGGLAFHTSVGNSNQGITERMRITGAGNVGIGLKPVAYPLEISGDDKGIALRPGGAAGRGYRMRAIDGQGTMDFVRTDSNAVMSIGFGTNVASFSAAGTGVTTLAFVAPTILNFEAAPGASGGIIQFGMREFDGYILPTTYKIMGGNVGIGTTAPGKVLEVNLGTSSAMRLTYDDANGSATTYMDTTVSSAGLTTFNAAGSAPEFVFSDPLTARIKPRVYATTSTATLAPEIDTYDSFELTALTVGLTIANHSTSTPTNFEEMNIRIYSAAAQTLTWGTVYAAGTTHALPLTTVAGVTMNLKLRYDSTKVKWVLLAKD
jgi:hypothetical protein